MQNRGTSDPKIGHVYVSAKNIKKITVRAFKSFYTKRLRLHHPLALMMDINAFYIEIYIKMQTLSLGVNGSLQYNNIRVISVHE